VRIVGLRSLVERKLREKQKSLTRERKIDNLEKFAKTSYAAEMILDWQE